MMERFILFGGEIYYANGGMKDYIASSTNPDVLRDIAEANDDLEWYHVFDTVEMKTVHKSVYQAHGSFWDEGNGLV